MICQACGLDKPSPEGKAWGIDGLESDSGVGGEAAVDGEDYAGDEACGFIVEEEEKSALKLLAFAESAHGRRGKNFAGARGGSAVIVEEKLCILLG